MKKRFKKKNKLIRNFKAFVILCFLYALISIIFDGRVINIKKFLLNSSLNTMLDKKSYLLNLLDINITTPKNIIYTSFNKVIDKKELSAFKYDFDDYDSYEKSNSVYIEDPVKDKEVVKKPVVYIYNTHQLEEYSSKIFNDYTITPNVMIASYTLKENLISRGISTIVETNNIKEYLNNHGLNYDYSYRASRYFMNEALKNNNSLKYFIDLHRDSAALNVTLLKKDNKEYARVLFVAGMDNKNSSENIKLFNELNEKIELKVPGISRGIMKKDSASGIYYIFNQDFSSNAVLIEVGGVENTIEHVYNTLEVLSDVLTEIIEEGKYGN